MSRSDSVGERSSEAVERAQAYCALQGFDRRAGLVETERNITAHRPSEGTVGIERQRSIDGCRGNVALPRI
jgi:hypothetical protein